MTTHGDPATGLGTPMVGPKTPITDIRFDTVDSHPPPRTGAPDTGRRVEPDLRTALGELRTVIDGTAYPLTLPGADEARQGGAALVAQLDDYLLPRLSRLDAPLLVVVGGSTGAGKSTLVNSLVQARVSAVGVLRPTTRSPVLVCGPADSAWFRQGDLLPGLTRTTQPGDRPDTLQLVAAPALPAGLAFLDAPDIDSVVDANRALATQLLAAADLWLFVTTAARYADAVPWELLRTAKLRGTVVALVLDRVPPAATDEVTAHLSEMLTAYGLAAAPLFVLPETVVDGQGLLPGRLTEPLRTWFARLAADSDARAAVIRQTLDGAVSALVPTVESLAKAADQQAAAAQALDLRVHAAYRAARHSVEQSLRDGRLLRGEVLARWQEFVGTGELFRTLEARVGRLRDRLVAAMTGRPAPNAQLRTAIESQLVTLLRETSAVAAEQSYAAWQAHPAGAALLTPELARPDDDLPERAERLVRDWQRGVLELVRNQGGDKRFVARSAAYAVNATGLAVMIAVFASTAFIPTGLEVAAAGGTTVAAQKVLEAIFGDQAIRTLAGRARSELLLLVDQLLDQEAARYLSRTAAAGVDAGPGDRLREAGRTLDAARSRTASVEDPGAAGATGPEATR
ncbi:ABC transporter [Plantactinospora soyae]|uniref:Energy-coupling factor transporter ATP-binding protein EcfA2 n=1 Tax=Plantactinospora soyae TaxID=1544732 RepID=A0A927M1L8_9ACTN|nr:ABC transporter [Plantactinospora soyae]MBE1485959.1 energy-coupling factor transporter ATP-binding protein EcfA2 [Plantactinospora soyae]